MYIPDKDYCKNCGKEIVNDLIACVTNDDEEDLCCCGECAALQKEKNALIAK